MLLATGLCPDYAPISNCPTEGAVLPSTLVTNRHHICVADEDGGIQALILAWPFQQQTQVQHLYSKAAVFSEASQPDCESPIPVLSNGSCLRCCRANKSICSEG